MESYRNNFETAVAKLLDESGLYYEYEPFSIELSPSFISTVESYERVGKVFSPSSLSIRRISYKPDFVGEDWIIETKGKRTKDFDIRWKLLKKKLTDEGMNVTLFMPRSIKQAKECIEIIKNANSRKSKNVLRVKGGVELPLRRVAKPKVRKATTTRTNRKRGQTTL